MRWRAAWPAKPCASASSSTGRGFPGGKFQALLSLPLVNGGRPLGVAHLFDFAQPAFELAQLLADRLAGNIRRNLYTLPPKTKIYPGHGPASTIGAEKKHNPFVKG